MQPLVRLLQSSNPSLHQAATAALEVITLDPKRRVLLEQFPPHVLATGGVGGPGADLPSSSPPKQHRLTPRDYGGVL